MISRRYFARPYFIKGNKEAGVFWATNKWSAANAAYAAGVRPLPHGEDMIVSSGHQIGRTQSIRKAHDQPRVARKSSGQGLLPLDGDE